MSRLLTDPAALRTAIVWFGALGTLGLYSILYRENRFFRFFEHLFLGLATGYALYATWNDILRPRWWEPIVRGQWWWSFALPAGLLFYLIYSKRYAWMSRLIFGLFIGFGAGQAFQGYAAYYFPLIRSAINVPLWHGPLPTALNNALFLVILLSVMSYFFFSFEQKNKAVLWTSRMGRYFLMFAFGSLFGSTIMARMSLLIGRIYFLLNDWLRVAR